jgi:hypothetical protein
MPKRSQRTSKTVAVRLLVGIGATDTVPTVAGCIDEQIRDALGPDESAGRLAQIKRDYVDLDASTEWREIVIELDADELAKQFGRETPAHDPATSCDDAV